MPKSSFPILLAACLAGIITLAAGAAPAPPGTSSSPGAGDEGARLFAAQVRPVLQEKCVACHSGDKAQGGLRLTSRDSILKGGGSGPAAVAGKPGESLLVKAIHYEGRRMPPQGKLAQPQIDALTRWVQMGLPWPAEQASLEPQTHHAPPRVTPETMKFWSFQPVRLPALPAVKGKEWVRTPIDRFILARLEAKGLQPNPPASRSALIRRAYYDMTGLPPSPEEVAAFVNDRSSNAWEKVVDRLLASPQYGEKWGRHWLDLVRFAESNSYERDGSKPDAWRYRDYVIQSFNRDKPYDQFIKEQIAGDELTPRTPEGLIATGYYRLGIWDDEPVDPEQALYDDLDDIASTTGQVFLGLTVGCARCHDHKIDPIPQKDYYRFLAFFSGLRRYGLRSPESVEEASLRPLLIGPKGEKQRQAAAEYRERFRRNLEGIGEIEGLVRPDLAPVEKEEWVTEARRVPLVKARVPRLVSQTQLDRYVQLVEERDRLRQNPPPALETALCVTEIGPQARETFVLMRGNAHAKGDKVEPGFPSVLAPPQPDLAPGPHGDTSGRRLALTKWLTDPKNPLTARAMVNRVWQYHFGRGIVRSTSNFGFQGDKPTHPELLDWLAARFMKGSEWSTGSAGSTGGGPSSRTARTPLTSRTAEAWRLKPLHRLILLSSTYRMSSRANPGALAKDPENDLFWRFDMRRLQAEEVRDSILAVNGSLNLKAGGPGIYTTIPAEVLAGQSMPGAGWGKSSPEEQCRRSVYIFVKRSLAVPIIASFDGPETDFTCPGRFATTQPTQALGMINSAWTNEQARLFARYLKEHAGEKPPDQVKLALSRTLQRTPTPAEIARGMKLIESLQKDEKLGADEALATFCLVSLNLDEFLYLD